MFSASESTHATTAHARSMPASCIVWSSEPRPSTRSTSSSSAYSRTSGLSSITTNGTPARAQVLGDLPADASEPANQVVVLELGDLALHAALVEQSGEVPGDEQLRQRDEDEEHRTHAEDRQEDHRDVAAEGLRVRDRPDGGDRVERPRETPPVGGVLELRESGCAAQHEHGHRAHQQRDAPQEEHHLVARAAARPGRSPTRVWKRSEIRVAGISLPGARGPEAISNGTARRPGSCVRETAAPAGPPARAGAEASSARTTACCRRAPARPRSSPNGPPTTNARSARDMRRSAISSARASLDSAFPSRSSAQT